MTLRQVPLLLVTIALTILRVAAAPVNFELSMQPANQALMAFARQANVEVLFSSSDLKKVQSKAVVGSYEPAAALDLLLEGTGYVAKLNAAGKFVVQRVRLTPNTTTSGAATSPDDPADLSASRNEKEAVIKLAAFVVTPSHFGIADERLDRNVTLTSAELGVLPQIGEDLYRAIGRLPGLSSNELSAKFLVRGAPNSQMLTRLDGVDLIEPFHLKDYDGALSIIDLETIGSIDLVTGGFTTDYGDRLAGVLTMETQPDPGAKLRTTLGLSVTNLRLTSQGEFADGKGQWLAAVRRGYIDLAVKLGGHEIQSSPTYYDFSGKVQYQLSPKQTVSLHVLYAADTFERLNQYDEPDLHSSYDSAYVWGRWQGEFGNRLSGETVLSLSQLGWHRKGDGLIDGGSHQFMVRDDRRLDTIGLRQDWTLNLTEHALVRTGFEYKSGEARYDYSLLRELWSVNNGALSTTTRRVNYALRPDGAYEAAYVSLRVRPWTPFIVEPGLRFERHNYTNDSGWSPRLNSSLALGRHTTVRAAWGLYQQAQGLQELSVQDRETKFSHAERAEQRVIGITHSLNSGIDLRLEAYQRLTTHLRPQWGNLVEVFNFFPEAQYDRYRIDPSRGRAHGIELTAEHRRGQRFGWAASYVYSVSEAKVDSRWIPNNWEQRHTFNLDLTYVPARNWQLSASWQIHSGWPYTDQNFYLQRLDNGELIAPWTYGPIGGLRSPVYHRLDLRATRTYHLNHGILRAYIDIFNAYNQTNKVGYDDHYAYIANGQLVVVKTPGTMLPILPSAGLSWEF